VPGMPHHVVQRGNNKGEIFFNDEDRAVYLFLLKTYSEKWSSAILCYCLMPNHVHLLVKPSSEGCLQKMMQGLTLCYTQHVNRKYRRTGRLWESRYHSCTVDQVAYLWEVARYIEQNPVRAGIARNPQDYRYSSAPAHFGLTYDPILGEELVPEIKKDGYIGFTQSAIPVARMKEIRQSVKTGRPLGTVEFVNEMERRLGKRLGALARGRPRKKLS